MTRTETIPLSALGSLRLKAGDTLRVVDVLDATLVVEMDTNSAPDNKVGAATEWVESARGSVKLDEGEAVDDARMRHYLEKYGLEH